MAADETNAPGPGMREVESVALPPHALLAVYRARQAYTDCFVTELPRAAGLAEYVEAFYTTPLFKLERALLGLFARRPATDAQARQLGQGVVSRFSAWSVEARDADQILLCDFSGSTRSWLMCEPAGDAARPATRLYFGSAVVPRRGSAEAGKPAFGFAFHALQRFHLAYSRALLRAAQARLSRRPGP